jgi:hypothetical protein
MCLTRTALSVKGDIIACTSDRRLKCSVFTIQSAVEKIKKIRGVEFEWNRKYIHDCNIGFEPTEKGKTVGFIAQELEEVIPTAVREAPLEGSLSRQVSWEEKYKTIKSEKVTPLLVEAVKEQQCVIEKQQKQIDRLTCHVEMLLGKCA